jgi:NitT/TauT family transport system substrate-binding protein
MFIVSVPRSFPRRPYSAELTNAKVLHGVLAEIGGTDLVGPAHELDPGTFYDEGSSE